MGDKQVILPRHLLNEEPVDPGRLGPFAAVEDDALGEVPDPRVGLPEQALCALRPDRGASHRARSRALQEEQDQHHRQRHQDSEPREQERVRHHDHQRGHCAQDAGRVAAPEQRQRQRELQLLRVLLEPLVRLPRGRAGQVRAGQHVHGVCNLAIKVVEVARVGDAAPDVHGEQLPSPRPDKIDGEYDKRGDHKVYEEDSRPRQVHCRSHITDEEASDSRAHD
mmetsp:Transcript_103858/g.293733  ORF Transcript_103858/g.293733 Transcript_103858/m.293733 type:complete len:223 (-) Transcript_103858:848-1516(-)